MDHRVSALRAGPVMTPRKLRRLLDLARRREAAFDVGDDVVDMLDPDRKPHIAVGHAGRFLLLRRSCECVVVAGWIARLRASPILAT